MELLLRTNEVFQEGIRVKVVRVESLSTMWVRICGWPRITYVLNWEMFIRSQRYLPETRDLTPGTFVAVLVNFRRNNFWDRGIILERTPTDYAVYLIDWALVTHHTIDSIRLLPERYRTTAPWVRRIRLRGVRDQQQQTIRHRLARLITLRKRSGCLFNIDTSPGVAMSARLVLDWREGEPPRDVGAHWLRLGYLDPE